MLPGVALSLEIVGYGLVASALVVFAPAELSSGFYIGMCTAISCPKCLLGIVDAHGLVSLILVGYLVPPWALAGGICSGSILH